MSLVRWTSPRGDILSLRQAVEVGPKVAAAGNGRWSRAEVSRA